MTSYDVVVLGSGIAGLAAALCARENGLRTLVIEKAPKLGGSTSNSWGVVWSGNNHLQGAVGCSDSRDETISYMRFVAGGEAIEENLNAFVDRGPEALKFFESCGIPFRVIRGMGDHYYGIAPGGRAEGRNLEVELISGEDLGEWQHRIHVPPFLPTYVTVEEILAWGGVNREADWDKEIVRERKARDMRGKGLGLISHFVKALIARDVPIRAGEKVDRLDVADGRVTGVIMSSGEKISARAGVVLATGGYEANPALVDAFEKMPNWMNICPVSTTGDGLLMGNAAGGATHFIRNNMELFLGFEIPPGEANPEPQFNIVGIVELFSPHTMVVNDRGERFGDESYFQKLIPGLRHFDPMRHRYANLPCFMIFDQQYASKFSFANVPAGAGIPDWVSRDDTIEGLAGKLGIDLAGLTKTIDRFNGFAGTGIDEDFHRGEIAWRLDAKSERDGPNPSLGPISKGPFYGIELRPCGSTSAGLLTNTHAQVLDNGRNAIPGLYAAGNTAARVEFGTGYQAGFTLSSGMTFGYLAAQHMRASSEVRT